MNPLDKNLAKLSGPKRVKFLEIFERIRSGKIVGLDIKKLHGKENQYRVRVGQWRIIFEQTSEGNHILKFATRNEKTYRGM